MVSHVIMMSLPEIGKLKPEIFNKIIFPNLGAENPSVLVGPTHGVDFGVIEIDDKVIVMTSDPVFIVPEYGWKRSAWFAVHILASDAAVSGIPPKYMAIDLNLPLAMTAEEFKKMWIGISNECKKLGISIVCGHTGKYDGCAYPMVGGAVVFGIGDKDKYVTPTMAKEGDKIIVTKGPAIETSGILSVMFPQVLEEKYGKDFVKEAQSLFWQQTAVKDALTVASVGVREDGVTAMHDATEYGLWGGLHEVANASRVGMRIYKEKIVVQKTVLKVCKAFSEFTGIEIDPFKSISEGTLIITVRPHKAEEVLSKLKQAGIPASIIGEVVSRREGIKIVENGQEKSLKYPEQDPFWHAFFKTVKMLSERKK